MNQSTLTSDEPRATKPTRVAFIQACWHRDIVDAGYHAFVAELARLSSTPLPVDRFEVPGSLEIPLEAQTLARSGQFALIVAAGFVVDGGIYRHEFVAQAVLDGIMRVQLDTGVPILSMVLTPQQFHESDAHLRFFMEHMPLKGREAAGAARQMLDNAASRALGEAA